MTMSHSRCPACKRPLPRSNQANRLYWALLHQISEKVLAGSYGIEAWHNYLKTRFLGADEIVLPNGKTLIIPKSSAALDVAEFGDYCDKVTVWAAERGVYLDSLEAA